MKNIFIDIQDQESKRFIVIEEDKNSIWSYLTFPNEERINKDCFLGSRNEISIDTFNFKNLDTESPPPITKEYSTTQSHMPDLKQEDVSIEWLSNGNVVLLIKGDLFLFFTKEERKGFSKSVSKNEIYGNKWNEYKYIEIIKQKTG